MVRYLVLVEANESSNLSPIIKFSLSSTIGSAFVL